MAPFLKPLNHTPVPVPCSYCAALREHPSAPAEVRLGLAAAAFALGGVERSEAAYRRVLAMEPGCVDALLGLATILLGPQHEAQVGGARWWWGGGQAACSVCGGGGRNVQAAQGSSQRAQPDALPALRACLHSPRHLGSDGSQVAVQQWSTPPLYCWCGIPQGLSEGLALLQRAHQVDPGHPGVLALLGHYSLLRGACAQEG